MSFNSLLNKQFKCERPTNELLAETTIAASMSLTRAAGSTCCMQVSISGADTDGTVDLIGDVAGTSTTETLTFSGAGTRQSKQEFDDGELTAVEPSGLTGNIRVDAVARDGQPVMQLIERISSFRGRVDDATARTREGLQQEVAGQDVRTSHFLFMNVNSTTLQGDDRITNTSDATEKYRVSGSVLKRFRHAATPHHWEVPLLIVD